MSAWQQSVEQRLGHQSADMRDLRIWFGAGVLMILGAFAAGFLFLVSRSDAQFDRVGEKLDAVATQVSEVRSDVAVLAERTAPGTPKP